MYNNQHKPKLIKNNKIYFYTINSYKSVGKSLLIAILDTF